MSEIQPCPLCHKQPETESYRFDAITYYRYYCKKHPAIRTMGWRVADSPEMIQNWKEVVRRHDPQGKTTQEQGD